MSHGYRSRDTGDAGEECFPLTQPKVTPFKLCVCAHTHATAEQTETQSGANQRWVLEVSSKEATQSIV